MKCLKTIAPAALGLALLGHMFTPSTVHAETNVWVGGGMDLHWSTAENWTNALPPAPGDDVVFNSSQALTNATVNNHITADTTIQSLRYLHTNLNSFHHTQIADGVTLTISNAVTTTNVLFVGTGLAMVNNKITASISGAHAALHVLAPTGLINVRQGGLQNFSGLATLDLSGLGVFTAQAQRVLVAGDGTNGSAEQDRPSGTMKLAQTNWFLLNSTNAPGWDIGQNIGNGGSPAILVLGLTNAMFNDYGLGVGRGRASDSRLYFGKSNSAAYFRNLSGTGRQRFWLIGDNSTPYSGNVAQGRVDFAGVLGLGGAAGTVDALVETVVVGRGVNNAKGLTNRACDGTLTLGAGILDVNTVEVGYQYHNYSANAAGLIRLIGSGSQMVVNNYLRVGRGMLVDVTNGVNRAQVSVENGATLTVAGPIYSGLNGSNTVNVTGGSTLVLKSTMGNALTATNGPLTNFKLANSTLKIDLGSAANPTTALCVTGNLDLSGTNALVLQGTGLTAGSFPLLQYASLADGGGNTFTTIQAPAPWQAVLSNNVANATIDVVLFLPLVMGQPQRVSGGGLQFSATGAEGLSYRILAATNLAEPLANWMQVGSGTLSGGAMTFTDGSATNFPQRFYRLVAP